MSYRETREEEELRKVIERLKGEEQVIRIKRQDMEARLRHLVWQRMTEKIEAPSEA